MQRFDTSEQRLDLELHTIKLQLGLTTEIREPASCRSPVDLLQERLGLSDLDVNALWMLTAFELDTSIRRALCTLTGDERALTVGALMQTCYARTPGRGLEQLADNGRLATQGCIELEPMDPFAPISTRRIRASARVVELATGLVRLDPAVASFAALSQVHPTMLTKLTLENEVLPDVRRAVESGEATIIMGRKGSGRRTVAAAALAARGSSALCADARDLSNDREIAAQQVRALTRECRLLQLSLLVCNVDENGDAGDVEARLSLLEDLRGVQLILTATHRIARKWKNAPRVVELRDLSRTNCAHVWKSALPVASDSDATRLATMYPLAPALIAEVSRVALREAGGTQMTPAHIASGLGAVLQDRMNGLARRIETKQRWADVVIPDDQFSSVLELISRIGERRRVLEDWGFAAKVGRGTGISALFSGPPGTGKTMMAGLIAKELGLELYQVDLSKISSKWIGETEKNLAAVFDAAEAGCAILLFDEADSLFGKRTEVKTSNDRHANQQVNFLLQRIESFTGTCILTSNHESAIDEAFRRRLSLHMRFTLPEANERAQMWKAMLPESAPVTSEIDFEALAERFPMSGGYIRNAVLRAAFLAAGEGVSITECHLERAAKLESEGMGKIVATTPAWLSRSSLG